MDVPPRLAALCGIIAPAVFVGGWAVNGLRTEGYDPLRDAISQLAREGAPTRPSMTACFVLFGVLIPVWAVLLGRLLRSTALRTAVVVAGLATVAVAALPLSAEGGQPQDVGHTVAAGLGYVAMAATPLVAATRLRGPARVLSLAVGLGSAGALVATLLVDGSGGLQRLGLTVVDAWHVAVAAVVLRRGTLPGRT